MPAPKEAGAEEEEEQQRHGSSSDSFVSAKVSDSSSSDSSCSSLSSTPSKPRRGADARWEAMQAVRAREKPPAAIGLSHFRLLRKLGCGDIGSVYLAELTGTGVCFAMKVMDKSSLATRKKILRAATEKEILAAVDHPFLPTLYSHFDTDKFSCLVMEYCPGGDLHSLRQRQPGKHFPEPAAKFYVAEVLLAMEYLHMLGVIYRDLKPENVLVREDGHIMLSDFDLSLRCSAACPTVVTKTVEAGEERSTGHCVLQPACFGPGRLFFRKEKKGKKQEVVLQELVVEPTEARSTSFVGTHEYLAPEIIKGDGHGSAVDWWTFGVFLYELLFGRTPFKGAGNRATLFNVVGQPLRFPEAPVASFAARDLVRGLLAKDPKHRLGTKRGAADIKQHPFFEGVNWALIRCAAPPEIPKPFDAPAAEAKDQPGHLEFDLF